MEENKNNSAEFAKELMRAMNNEVEEKKKPALWKRILSKLYTIVVAILSTWMYTIAVAYGWNNFISTKFNLPTIDWQFVLAIDFVVSLIFISQYRVCRQQIVETLVDKKISYSAFMTLYGVLSVLVWCALWLIVHL